MLDIDAEVSELGTGEVYEAHNAIYVRLAPSNYLDLLRRNYRHNRRLGIL